MIRETNPPARNGSDNNHGSGNDAPARNESRETPADTVQQAVDLQTLVREVVTKTNALIRQIRRENKRRRAVESTLASLRQLDEVVG